MYTSAAEMVCPVGLWAEAACAAMRAGLAKFDELPYFDTRGEVVIGSAVPGLSAPFEATDRLVELLTRAVAGCVRDQAPKRLASIPFLVGLAEPGRPGGGAGLADSIVARVECELGLQFHPRLSRALPKGHTAGFELLREARGFLRDGSAPACLVCGVDSYINADSLLWLEQHWRLKSPEYSDGVIPGEGAAAVLVQAQPPPRGLAPVKVAGIGFGFERASVLSEEPLLGLGLAGAVGAALDEAGIAMPGIAFRISDVTGEQYGFKEQALTQSRLLKVPVESMPIWHCADSIGDSGAAAGICQLVIAALAYSKGYAPGDTALCFTSAVPGDRAALVLARDA